MLTMTLRDDGTLDTVIACQCGAEHRYTYDPAEPSEADGDGDAYLDFVDWCLADAATACTCHLEEA